jgi:hypothetical protein
MVGFGKLARFFQAGKFQNIPLETIVTLKMIFSGVAVGLGELKPHRKCVQRDTFI